MHPVPTSAPSKFVIDGLPVQLSVTSGVPVGKEEGLHPRSEPEGHVVNDGFSVSTV